MPIIKSAKKRIKVAGKAAIRNSKTKRKLKSSRKEFAKKPTATSQSALQSQIDKASKKGVIHKNKAARLKSKAAKFAKESELKTTKSVKAPAKKAATKKK